MSTESRPRRAPADDGLLIVGLVGRTGSGKSTVARALAATGAVVIEGDALGHEVTDRDPEVRQALAAEYGADVYRADGTLDRARVAARVFADDAARARLDALVHPRIVSRIGARIEALRAGGFRGVVVIDAALLLEWGLERACDVVIAVTAPEAEQVRRLTAARGWSRDEASRRLSVQRPNRSFGDAADLTLDNAGTRDALEAQVRETVAGIARARAGGGAPPTGKER